MKSSEVIVEFSTTNGGNGGSDEKEYLLQLAADLYDALYTSGGNPQAVKDVKNKIEMAGGTVKILHGRSVPGSSVRELDGTFQVVMYHPKYFKQGYLIRLVGDSPDDVSEGEVIKGYFNQQQRDAAQQEKDWDEYQQHQVTYEEKLKRLAAWWWNNDESPAIEKKLAAMGLEIGQDEGYDNGGVFIVASGDVNGNSYISWPAEELENIKEGQTPLDEKWSEKYKRSINCNNPKGFSQRAHCQGRKKHNESMTPPGLHPSKSKMAQEPGHEVWWKSHLVGITIGKADNDRVLFKPTLEKFQGIDSSNIASLPIDVVSIRKKSVQEHIVKVKGGYELRSKKTGRNLGKYPTRAGAEKRERQVQYFKHANESITESIDDFEKVHSAIRNLLPVAMEELGIKQLPKIHIKKNLDNEGQPSFGVFNGADITLAVSGRHPVDICRTLAHELTHYSQGTQNKLDHESGETGSPEENEANSTAGIIMRKFSMKHPEYMKNED